MYRLLIVEDDMGIAQAIKEQARVWGLEAAYVEILRNVMSEFAAFSPHLVPLS